MGFLDHRRFFVYGLARSGCAVAALLVEHGYDVTAYDDDPRARDSFTASPDATRVTVADDGSWRERLDACDCLVVSPGVPLDHEAVKGARKRGIPVAGEVEAAFHFSDARVVGVTGTNGKSTVTGVVGGILAAGGVDVAVAGNIGEPYATAVRAGDHDTMVLELSSFQLDTIDEFRVDVGVLLNVTPDHLDRYHHSFEEYTASKARILNRAEGRTFFVYNAEDPVAARLGKDYAGPKLAFSSRRRLETGVYHEDGVLWRSRGGRRDAVLARNEFTPLGLHNMENAMAAVAAATPFDVDLDAMRDALRAYRPLPHRMELVRVTGGVAWVNDSKATNVDATVKSLASIEGGVVLILGGRDKEGDFTALHPYLDNVRGVVLIGEAGPVIRRALDGRCRMEDASDMEDAVDKAAGMASAGDTVLLAPACASFDMFENYARRGEAFRNAVSRR